VSVSILIPTAVPTPAPHAQTTQRSHHVAHGHAHASRAALLTDRPVMIVQPLRSPTLTVCFSQGVPTVPGGLRRQPNRIGVPRPAPSRRHTSHCLHCTGRRMPRPRPQITWSVAHNTRLGGHLAGVAKRQSHEPRLVGACADLTTRAFASHVSASHGHERHVARADRKSRRCV